MEKDKFIPMMISMKIGSFIFKGVTEQEAYIKGCKKVARFVASKKYSNITHKVVNKGDNTFEFTLYTTLDINNEQGNFCKMCKEMHCSFFVNEEYNCSRCNYKTFMKRMQDKLCISRSYYREHFKK